MITYSRLGWKKRGINLNNILNWAIGTVGVLALGIIAWLKAKAERAIKAKEKAQAERDAAVQQADFHKAATKAKDSTLAKQKQNAKAKQDVDRQIKLAEEVPEDAKIEQQQQIIDDAANLFNSRNRPK